MKPDEFSVGVVGSGIMGAGIAQVAAMAGHAVQLYDARAGAAEQACGQIGKLLQQRVQQGKLEPAERAAAMARLRPVPALAALSGCGLVIEAIVEQLEAKRALFGELEAALPEDAVLASNTSSLSITALARDLRRPQRLAGMHFFNPVPAMRLVEVVAGLATDEAVLRQIEALARDWGKTPVRARSTPGFIVNRIARPFYAEALMLLHERRATPPQIDAALRGAGFRMGPCELMDLIGHDVNFAVTCGVFEANFGDRRYAPSPVQRELVDGGRLGRKSGRGFYLHDGAEPAQPPQAAPTAVPMPATVLGRGALADAAAQALQAAGLLAGRDEQFQSFGLLLGTRAQPTALLLLTDGRPAGQLAAQRREAACGVFDLPLQGQWRGPLAVAFAAACPAAARATALAVLAASGVQPIEIGDAPGLVAARTVAMLVNEAADAVQQGVCDAAAADTAMRLGVNYPGGPFEWLERFGAPYVVRVLEHLDAFHRGERYRASPWLLERAWSGEASDAV